MLIYNVVVVKKIGSSFSRNISMRHWFDSIKSLHSKPNGELGSIKALVISTTIRAMDLPSPSLLKFKSGNLVGYE